MFYIHSNKLRNYMYISLTSQVLVDVILGHVSEGDSRSILGRTMHTGVYGCCMRKERGQNCQPHCAHQSRFEP